MAIPLQIGTATAAFQVEGATTADGRGDSIWDVLCRVPGAIEDGSDGSLACGSYRLWETDLDLVRDLGTTAYRFSVAWPRVQPDGRGPALEAGLDRYDRMVDGCLARGLEPLPTLYHWDLPAALDAPGTDGSRGWGARSTAEAFADYAGLVATRLGDRVSTWSTLNEPWCSAFLGHAAGVHAPGRRDPVEAYTAAHHLLLAHALGAQAVRAAATVDGGAQVGIVLNLYPVRAVAGPDGSATSSAAEQVADAVDHVDAVQNRLWLDALLDGRYPDRLAAQRPSGHPSTLGDPAVVREGDLALVRGSMDWLGVNYYTPYRVAAAGREPDPGGHCAAFPGGPDFSLAPRGPLTTMDWEVDPSGLTELLVGLSRRAPRLPLRVTENGAAYPDDVRQTDGPHAGSIDDPQRTAYLLEHLEAVLAARAQGADVRTYVMWTLLDNFEWSRGYTQKFGLVEVLPGTLERRPKASYRALAHRLVRP